MGELICELKKVSKKFKKSDCCPIKKLDMKINVGDYISIEGASGVGKSTLLYLIGGLISPTEGEIVYFGENVKTEKDFLSIRKKYISYIFQDYRYIEFFTVEENLMFAARNRRLSKEKIKEEVEYYLEILYLQDKKTTYPYNLSGGQKRRLMIAIAMIRDTQILIADEPTNDLDVFMEEQVLDLFDDKIKEGKTIILSTHNQRVSQRVNLRYQIEASRLSVLGGDIHLDIK